MSNASFQPDPKRSSQEYYVIRIKGHLAPSWSEAFEGMQLTLTRRGETLITGVVADQAALHGLLARIRDLNLTLISVIRVKPEQLSHLPKRGQNHDLCEVRRIMIFKIARVASEPRPRRPRRF